jgi:hypothetical protein
MIHTAKSNVLLLALSIAFATAGSGGCVDSSMEDSAPNVEAVELQATPQQVAFAAKLDACDPRFAASSMRS